MARFVVKVDSMAMSTVTDTETGKVYNCKNIWYQRDGFRKFYVDVTIVETKQMKDKFSFPWKAEILADGKLKGKSPVGMVHNTDLAGKTSTAMPLEDAFI
jgi:hypothetical protein